MEFVCQILMKLKASSSEGLLMKVLSHSLMWLSKHCSGHYVTTQACTLISWGCVHLPWCGALDDYTLCITADWWPSWFWHQDDLRTFHQCQKHISCPTINGVRGISRVSGPHLRNPQIQDGRWLSSWITENPLRLISAKRKDHHGVSSGWSSVWHRSNTGLSSKQYEQIPIILGVLPFWLTPFSFFGQ